MRPLAGEAKGGTASQAVALMRSLRADDDIIDGGGVRQPSPCMPSMPVLPLHFPLGARSSRPAICSNVAHHLSGL